MTTATLFHDSPQPARPPMIIPSITVGSTDQRAQKAAGRVPLADALPTIGRVPLADAPHPALPDATLTVTVTPTSALTDAAIIVTMPTVTAPITTPTDAVIGAPMPPQRRRYKPRARRCKCGCARLFTPTPTHPQQRYATKACAQRARRAKRRDAQPKRPSRPNGLGWYVCESCGERYVGIVGKGRKYCSSRCKRAAAKARRTATAAGLARTLGVTQEKALDLIDICGMRTTRAALLTLTVEAIP